VSSSLRRGVLAAALALPLSSLAACGAGHDAQTLQVKPDTANVSMGDIELQNVTVLTQGSGDGPASVTARIFNNGNSKQSLETLTVGSEQVRLSATDGGQTLIVPANGSILLGGKGNPSATIPDSTEAARDGDFQKVTFTFSDTGAVSVQAHVQPAKGYFAPYGPTPAASPSVSGSASPTTSGSPAGHAASPSNPTPASGSKVASH
jgi:hypothetical protein